MPDVFVSYAQEDEDWAKRLYRDLRSKGVSPWLASEDLIGGSKWKRQVVEKIRESKYALILLSEASVAKRGYMQKEVKVAIEVLDQMPENEIFILPVRLEECQPSHSHLGELHWIDLFKGYGRGFHDILRALRKDPEIEKRVDAARKENHRIWAASELYHRLGELAGQREWTASPSSGEDYLVYGQYVGLGPGKYSTAFRLKVDNNAAPNPKDCVAQLDVSSNTGTRTITSRALARSEFTSSDAYQVFEVPFKLEAYEDRVEMRVFYTNIAQLTVDTIELRELS